MLSATKAVLSLSGRCANKGLLLTAVMLTNRSRLAVIAICVALGVWLFLTGSAMPGLLILAAGAILAPGYFRHGPVWLAMRALGRADMDRATSHLSSIAHPQRLERQSQAYFEMASGLVATARGRSSEAEEHLRRALDLPLRTQNDRAMAELRLAELLVGRSNAEAGELLDHAAERSTKPQVDAEIDRVRDLLRAAV